MITDTLNIFTSHCEAKGRGNLIPFQPSPLGGWVIIFLRLPRSPATEGSLAMSDSIGLFSHGEQSRASRDDEAPIKRPLSRGKNAPPARDFNFALGYL